MPVKRIDIKEFVDFGYLHELNREFLHPLGLALEVTGHDDGSVTLSGVWDSRDDPDGIIFGEDVLDPEKARRVAEERERRRPVREAQMGYWQQPIPMGDTDE